MCVCVGGGHEYIPVSNLFYSFSFFLSFENFLVSFGQIEINNKTGFC